MKYFLILYSVFHTVYICVQSNLYKKPPTAFEREVSIKTASGTVIGYTKQVQVFGEPYKVTRFLGIPYAESPTGALRFQKPVARKPFPAPFVAKQHGLACLQQDSDFLEGKEIERGEDCLNLNVYTPEECGGEKCGGKKLAVMVWIHGGGFTTGSSNPYEADYLTAYGNVIVVTINYRLSVWGFLSLGNISPGNNGLWDQHLALRWVHDNIEYFGGDKARVTVFGQSVGAASVVYQSLYEGNQGLFQRAIAQSSSVTSPWAFADKSRDDEMILAKLLGCEIADFYRIFQCINSSSNENLLEALEKLPGPSSMLRMLVIATRDGEFVKESPVSMFSSDNPDSNAGHKFFSSLDFLSGATSTESTLHALLLAGADDIEQFSLSQEHFDNNLVPLVMKKLYNTEVPDVVLDLVRAEYRNWNEPDNQTSIRDNYIKLMCDICHNRPLIQTVQSHASSSKKKTHVYNFDEKPSKQICPTPQWSKGSHHSDELQFVFGVEPEGLMSWLPGDTHRPQDWERSLSKSMMTYWTNFAKSGNPNQPKEVYHEWPQYKLSTQKYLDITRKMSSRSTKSYLHARSAHFWLKVIPPLMKEQL